jgi:FkbM family methyltransferase
MLLLRGRRVPLEGSDADDLTRSSSRDVPRVVVAAALPRDWVHDPKTSRLMSIPDVLRVSRRALRSLVGRDLFYRREVTIPRLWLGAAGASWCVCPVALRPESVVYSFGVGEDVSFELALIERFNVRVNAFEPTPRSLAWVRSQALPAAFVLHEFGLAAWDGTASFSPPLDPTHVSYSMVRSGPAGSAIHAPVRRLATIADMLGHTRINLLKMDIEGAEYAVLADCLSNGLEIDQVLVEFHHRWDFIGVAETKRAISLLKRAGYRIANVSPNGCEYTLLHNLFDG